MQNILISGANGNLGQAVVDKLIADGYHLFATTGKQYQGGFNSQPQIDPFQVDLTDATAAQALVEEIIQKGKSIQAGIFLVGTYAPGHLLESSQEEIEKMIQINFFTALHLAQPLITHFINQGGGQLIFIGAKGAIESNPGGGNFAYNLSKSLLFKFAEIINSEYTSRGITATMIVPSTIDTPTNRKAMPQADFTKWVPTEDIADTISFMLGTAGQNLRQPIFKIYNQS